MLGYLEISVMTNNWFKLEMNCSMPLFAWGLLFVLLQLSGCLSPSSEVALEGLEADNLSEEFRSFLEQRYPGLQSRIILAFPDSQGNYIDQYESILDSMWTHRSRFSQWVSQQIIPVPLSQLARYELKNTDTIIGLIYTQSEHSSINEQTPLSWEGGTFYFLEKLYDEQSDVVIFGDTQGSSNEMYILAANHLNNLKLYLPYAQSAGYHVFRGEKRIVTGSWGDTVDEWVMASSTHRDLYDEISASQRISSSQFYNHREALTQAEFDEYVNQTSARYNRVIDFLGAKDVSLQPINYYLYDRFEDKGTFFGDFFSSYGSILPDVKHVSVRTNEVHRAMGQEIDQLNWYQDVQPILYQLLGEASFSFVETGLGMYFSEDWQQRGYEYWAVRLMHGDQIPRLKELLDDKRELYISPFIVEALSGSFVNLLIEEWGLDTFLVQYASWRPSEEEIIEIEKTWKTSLMELYAEIELGIQNHRALFPEVDSFQKGFTYAPNPGRYGYLTQSSDTSLSRLHGLGVNAVALVPYASSPTNRPVSFFPERRMNGENDASMVHAILDAKRLGQAVMLKPQLYVSGSWTGELEMTTESDWDAFFLHYERWISHYAMMAELYEVELLCIGTELVKATLHEERWIEMVQKIRKLYSGKIVYASNWGEEFERITFWPHFDFIGLDNYYPLSQADSLSDQDLLAAAQQIAERIEDIVKPYDMPVLFTEIGFPGIKTPWKQPHEERGEPEHDGLAQSRSYNAWFEALYGKPWMAGIYWWKWFSYDPEVNHSTDFVPQRKQTEFVIKDWYSKEW